jgi:hypothetical protein
VSEVTVTYSFHPLVGHSLLVVGSVEHGGLRHLIVREQSDGRRFLLPEWMTLPAAGAIRIVSCPRLSVNQLFELGTLIDRLMISSASSKHGPGGMSNEPIAKASDLDCARHTGFDLTDRLHRQYRRNLNDAVTRKRRSRQANRSRGTYEAC